MQKISEKDRNSGLSSIKIKETKDNNENYTEDEVKILEISNIIDKWEDTVLFSQNGFYSFKGKEVKNKSREFIEELNKLINTKIDEEKFSDEYSKEIVLRIKKNKITAIADKMAIYENSELENWRKEVYQESISSSINRAVLYKNDIEVVVSSLNNGLSVLKAMAINEEWNDKTLELKTAEYKSEFYYSLVKAFMSEKDINAYKYYQQCKNYINTSDKDELEKALYELKVNIIAYNWAKEVFSYKLPDNELEKKIKKVEDKDIATEIRRYIKDFTETEKRKKELKETEAEEKNWQEIITAAENNSDKSFLYIDYTLSERHIKAVKDYIKQIKESGFIKTDKSKFVQLLTEMFNDFGLFKRKNITFYRAYLSNEDYKFFEDCREMQFQDYENLYYDYKFSMSKVQKLNLQKEDDIYTYAKLLINSLKEFRTKNKREPDIQERNKLIEAVSQRFTNNKEDKQ